MTIDWWPAPSAVSAGPWDWTPAFHLGALLAAIAPAAIVLLIARRKARPVPRRTALLLGGATALLVVALSWPLADIAQVALWARTVQYLLLTLAVPPLLLLGTPRWRASGRGWLRRTLEHLASAPWIGALLLALAAWTTHAPGVLDALEASRGGDALVRAAWFFAALLFWWPMVGPGPERERLPYLASLGYLVLPFVFPKVPAITWVFSADPVYEHYTGIGDAARPWAMTATVDQGLAGFIMWFPGSVMIAVTIYLLIRHWVREDRRLGLRERLGVPADPRAVSALMAAPGSPDLWQVLEALVRIVDDAAPPRSGSDLAFTVEGTRVTLLLHVPGTEEEHDALERRIEAGYAVHLRRYSAARAEAIRARLAVEVRPYGTRVQ